MMTELVFWCSIGTVIYAYLGYPCALLALGLVRSRPVRKGHVTPRVSFIITAHNEEARIAGKIQNTFEQDYPRGRFEIIVASDCSTDRTDDIVATYSHRVRRVRAGERRGKEAAQQLAVQMARGEILVFSDVATALDPGGVSTIVRSFADPTVGCVSSIDRFIGADGQPGGEGAYVRYEMGLRALESRVNSLVGLSGSFFAVRRDVCRQWAPDRQSDFSTPLRAVEMGLRAVLDPECAGYYRTLSDDRREFQRKTRTVVRGLGVFAANLRLLNPLRYGLFAWQLASHKLCRWLVPFALLLAVACSARLAPQSPLYASALGVQVAFYLAAAGSWTTGRRVLRIPRFFVLANLAILVAWFRYARGERMTAWNPSERPAALPHTATR